MSEEAGKEKRKEEWRYIISSMSRRSQLCRDVITVPNRVQRPILFRNVSTTVSGVPGGLQRFRCRPCERLIAQPQPQKVAPLVFGPAVRESLACVDECSIVPEHHVSALAIEDDTVFLGGEVHRVEGVGLRVRHGWDSRASRGDFGTGEDAPGKSKDHFSALVEEQRSIGVCRCPSEPMLDIVSIMEIE